MTVISSKQEYLQYLVSSTEPQKLGTESTRGLLRRHIDLKTAADRKLGKLTLWPGRLNKQKNLPMRGTASLSLITCQVSGTSSLYALAKA